MPKIELGRAVTIKKRITTQLMHENPTTGREEPFICYCDSNVSEENFAEPRTCTHFYVNMRTDKVMILSCSTCHTQYEVRSE